MALHIPDKHNPPANAILSFDSLKDKEVVLYEQKGIINHVFFLLLMVENSCYERLSKVNEPHSMVLSFREQRIIPMSFFAHQTENHTIKKASDE